MNEIEKQLNERRKDKAFVSRLKTRVEEDKHILHALSEKPHVLDTTCWCDPSIETVERGLLDD